MLGSLSLIVRCMVVVESLIVCFAIIVSLVPAIGACSELIAKVVNLRY